MLVRNNKKFSHCALVCRLLTCAALFSLLPSYAAAVEAVSASASSALSQAQPSAAAKLTLTIQPPTKVWLPATAIHWEVTNVANGSSQQVQGNHLPLTLSAGTYQVVLQVDNYREQQQVTLTAGAEQVPRFVANFGRVRVSTAQRANWQVRNLRGEVVFTQQGSHHLNVILAAGDYEIEASLENARQVQRVSVQREQPVAFNLTIPTGKVKLMATLGNFAALRPMQWRLYRLENNTQEELSVPQRHSAMLVLAPGRYEAVATLDGRERRREFTVFNGGSSDVIIAMD